MTRLISVGVLLLGACSAGHSQVPDDTVLGEDGARPRTGSERRAAAEDTDDDDTSHGADTTSDPRATAPTCHRDAVAEPRWWDRSVGYEIFVRSFQDSDDDGIGDFAGLTSRLDYLNDGDAATTTDLGVDLLWLMPIHDSPSYHGYDVADYRAVEPDYGTDEDLDALLAAAHQRGIRVVADLVMNHSSSQHPWFADARTGALAQHRDFYVWSDTALDWDRPWGPGPTWHADNGSYYYALFWEGMPDLNFANAAVQAEMTDVALHWLGRGLDGYRLDAARYLVETGPAEGQADTSETHAYWRKLAKAIDGQHEDALLIGEVWTDNAIVTSYFGTSAQPELDMNFDFDTAGGVVDAVQSRSAVPARVALCARLDTYPSHGSAGTFLTNHDMRRLASRLDAAGADGLRQAAAWLLTAPGTPWLYYGQEIGMRNGSGGGDEAKRLPMQWEPGVGVGFTQGVPWRSPQSMTEADTVAHQLEDAASLLSLHRTLIQLRRAHPALSLGSADRVGAEGSVGTPMALRRELDGDAWVLVFQFASEASTITLAAADLPEATEYVDALDADVFARFSAGDELVVDVPGRGFRLLRATAL